MKISSSQYRSEKSLEHAIDEWGSSVYKLAFAQTASKSDAEDIHQEVFLRFFKSSCTFKSSEHLKAWLLRVTINCCHDLARSSWKKRIDTKDPTELQEAHPPNVTNEHTNEVGDLLKELPEELRIILHLYYYEGYSSEEISRVTETNSSTIRSRMQSARKKLEKLLGGTSIDS